MTKDQYLPRLIESELQDLLTWAKAIEIRGVRACGKTETARQFAHSALSLDSSDPLAQLSRTEPSAALGGATPRLLDEWQLIPGLWNAVRHEVDDRRQPGQFILTGSSAPVVDPLRHSGAGRFIHLQLRTMSLLETGHSSGTASLAAVFDGTAPDIMQGDTNFDEVVERITSGGWPGWLHAPWTVTKKTLRAYAEDSAEHDFPTLAGSRRDPRRFFALLQALSSLIAQPATLSAIRKRMIADHLDTASPTLVNELYDYASRMYLVEDQPAWSPRLRSASTSSQLPVRHLADPALACALLGAGPDRLLGDPETFGFIFKSQVVHDLRVYAQSLESRGVFHFRDSKGRDEIDAVIELDDSRWAGFAVAMGNAAVDNAASRLLRIATKMENQPEFLAVVIPHGVGHKRPDGVYVLPLTTLGP